MPSTRNPKSIFLTASDIQDLEQRAAFLQEACGSDLKLRDRVEALLKAHFDAGNFMQPPTGAYQPIDPATSATAEWAHEKIGERIGPYKLLQQLGEGGMGSVWVAEQEQPVKRRVALKLIKAGMDSAQVLRRFEAERQALALMDHPNIAKVLDAGTTAQGRPYFAMELVKGIPITQYCDQEQLSPRQRLELFIPVCQAVQHAHQKGIVHRDLKPSNVLIGLYDGLPIAKVIDFGVAKATQQSLTDRTIFTEVGTIIGTIEYMAPEQAELNNLDIDTRADIYSLGVLLYELLTGSPPFSQQKLRGAAFNEMLRIIREEEPPKPSTKLSHSDQLAGIAAKRQLDPQRLTRAVVGDLDWIVMKCLEKERSRRYETANGLALELSRYLHDEPVLAGPPRAGYRFAKFVRRNRRSVIAAAVLILAMLAGICGTTWGLLQTRAERDAKEKARELAEVRRIDAEKQRNHAAEQARITTAVNDFLCQDLLRQSDTRQQSASGFARNPDLTVKQALDRAAASIRDRFRDQPNVESAIRLTIGDAYRGLGLSAMSLPHAEAAYQTKKSLLGPNDATTLLAQHNLAATLVESGRLDDAFSELTDVLERRRTLLGADDPVTLRTEANLADLERLKGRIPESIRRGESVLTRTEAKLGPDHHDTLTVQNNLMISYEAVGRYPDAMRMGQNVLERRQRGLGHDHPDTLVTQNNLAGTYLAAGQFVEAIRLIEDLVKRLPAQVGADHADVYSAKHNLANAYQWAGRMAESATLGEEVLAWRQAKLGLDHPFTLITQNNLILAYQALNRMADAVRLMEDQVAKMRGKLGDRHPDTLSAQHNLAFLYQNANRSADALRVMEAVHRQRIDVLGADHVHTLLSQSNLAFLYQQFGRIDEALPLMLDTLERQRRLLSPDHPNTLSTLHNVAFAYQAKGQLADAIREGESAWELRKSKLGAEHIDTLQTQHNLAGVYVLTGRFTEALPMLVDVHAKMAARLGAEHPMVLSAQHTLGESYFRAERCNDAEPILRSCLTGREKTQPNAWTTSMTRSYLGATLAGQKKFADAEPLLLRGAEDLQKQANAIPNWIRTKRQTEALDRLIRLYELWEKPGDADKWKQKRQEIADSDRSARPTGRELRGSPCPR